MSSQLAQPPGATRVFSTWVRLPAFTKDVHEAFRLNGIDCFRIPPYSREATDARLELEATQPFEALARIRATLAGADIYRFNPTGDVIHWPQERSGPLHGDGEPE